MYRFFTGHAPWTTHIVPERHVVLSGRATLFPANSGAAGTTVQIWEVNSRTGFRKGNRPKASFPIGANGAWGPFFGSSRKHYEFAILWPASTHHFYSQPFVRSDRLIRLLTAQPGTGLDALREKSPNTSSFTFVRYKELWGDQGPQNDVLKIDRLNVLTPTIAPRTKRLNALFAFDHELDGQTDLERADTGGRRPAVHLRCGRQPARFDATQSHHPREGDPPRRQRTGPTAEHPQLGLIHEPLVGPAPRLRPAVPTLPPPASLQENFAIATIPFKEPVGVR